MRKMCIVWPSGNANAQGTFSWRYWLLLFFFNIEYVLNASPYNKDAKSKKIIHVFTFGMTKQWVVAQIKHCIDDI